MSKELFKRASAAVTATATILSLAGYALPALGAAPADFGLTEGDVISAAGSDDPDVYIVNELGYKRLFLNPVIFNFYGHLGGFAAVKNVSPATRDAFPTSGLFRNCETGDQKVYGLESTAEDTGLLHWVNTSGAQAVMDDPNFFKKVFCINNNEFNWYAKGNDYTSVNQVPNYVRGGTSPVPGGPLSASLAADNPAQGTLLEEQGLADLAHFNVSGSGLVTKVVLKRLGVSGDATLSNVFLFVNGLRVSDGNTFADNTLTFNDANGFFQAPATLAVRANVANGEAGKTVGVGLTMLNTSSVNANGNVHFIASENGDLSDIAVGAPSGGGSLDPQADVTLWQSDLGSGVNDVWLKRLSLRLVGSAGAGDFANLRLLVDGVQVATGTGIDSRDYTHFLANHKITTNAAGILRVVGDIVGGAGDTYQFQLRGAYDLDLVDSDFNAGVIPTGTFPASPASGTIGAASLTVVKATNSPSGDLVDTTDDASLAIFTFTAYGEAIKVDELSFKASTSDAAVGSLRDGRVLINGTQYGSTQTLGTLATAATYTVNYTFQPGVATNVEVRADAHDNDGTDDLGNADTLFARLMVGSSNAEGVQSGNTLNAPSSTLSGNTRTIVTGAMTLAKDNSYANQTVVAPQSSMKIGDYALTGSNTETINLTNFNVDVNALVGTTDANELRDMFVKYGTQQTAVRSTVNATQDFSINYGLGINEVLPVEVWAQVLSTASVSGDQFNSDLHVTGTTSPSGSAVTAGETTGQTVSIGAGSLSVSRDTGVANSDLIVGDEQTVTGVGWEFTAVNEAFRLSRLNVDLPNATGISEVRIMDGGTLVMSLPAQTDMTFNIAPANQPLVSPSAIKELTVDLVLSTIASPGAGASGANHTVTLDVSDSRKISQSSGVESAITGSDIVGKALYAYKAVPLVSRLGLPSSLLGDGTKTLAKFSVGSAGTGTIGWLKAILNYSATAGVTFSQTRFYDAANESSALSGTVASTGSTISFLSADELPAGDYVVKAVVAGVGADDSLSVTWGNSGLTFVAPTASASVGATATLVWTDRFSLPHTELTPDWNNDYLVKNLPMDSWTLSN